MGSITNGGDLRCGELVHGGEQEDVALLGRKEFDLVKELVDTTLLLNGQICRIELPKEGLWPALGLVVPN